MVGLLAGCAAYGEKVFRNQNRLTGAIIDAERDLEGDDKKTEILYALEEKFADRCGKVQEAGSIRFDGEELTAWQQFSLFFLLGDCSLAVQEIEERLQELTSS